MAGQYGIGRERGLAILGILQCAKTACRVKTAQRCRNLIIVSDSARREAADPPGHLGTKDSASAATMDINSRIEAAENEVSLSAPR
jgi:hypothetical protein